MSKREEQIKLEVAKKYFPQFDCTNIIGNIDFSVAVTAEKDELFHGTQYLLWAEAKQGTKANIYDSLVQLIMTIGKEKTKDNHCPPVFLGAFDEEKIIFIEYHKIQDVFYQNDFDWTVAPSDHNTKEFKQLKNLVSKELNNDIETYFFYYDTADRALESFIKKNFKVGKKTINQVDITKGNFIYIYNEWSKSVKPHIAANWDLLTRLGYLDGYFFIADMLSLNNKTIKDKLRVLLCENHYKLEANVKEGLMKAYSSIEFNDDMKAHHVFWAKYKRPPREDIWDYFLDRADLLVPQDIREIRGTYYTPEKWVIKSREYISQTLGEDWQSEYYIWDCCAGTGNLLAKLDPKCKYRVWASTLENTDVNTMHQLYDDRALLPSHIFQFDFLNDSFDDAKVPADLKEVLNDSIKRNKLIIYINPPYKEAGNAKQSIGRGKNNAGVAITTACYSRYKPIIGKAAQELFAQFFARVFFEIPGSWLAEFSTLKILQAQNFADFRKVLNAKLERFFIVPADTFDNVTGNFPIGFFIWNTQTKKNLGVERADVFNSNGEPLEPKYINSLIGSRKPLTKWLSSFRDKEGLRIGDINQGRNDFQNQKYCYIKNDVTDLSHRVGITLNNILPVAVYFAVRHCISATWLNDRDQFFEPSKEWATDREFQYDSLVFLLFDGQNNISATSGTNHWIPFTEEEVGAKMLFNEHTMSNFIRGKHKPKEIDLFNQTPDTTPPSLQGGDGGRLIFSPEAQAVFDAGRELWRYYHSQYGANPNASFYDIRAHFQGQDAKGKMNSDSNDPHYTELIQDLRQKQRVLAKKIEIGVYKYGFLYSGAPAAEDEPTDLPQEEQTIAAPETNLKDIVKHHKPSSKKVINYNITVNGTMNVGQIL